MNNLIRTILLVLLFTPIGTTLNAAIAQQSGDTKTSETRLAFLEKSAITSRLISDIDLKWNWIVVTPVEDSIAKAQGWYVYMGKRREELKAELITLQYEQLNNYYQDILDFTNISEDERQNLVSEMQSTRAAIAQNYPTHASYFPKTEIEISNLRNWITGHHDEYLALTEFLEKLVISHS